MAIKIRLTRGSQKKDLLRVVAADSECQEMAGL